MFDVDTAISDLNSYGNLQYQIGYIIDSLNKAIDVLNDISIHAEGSFIIDESRIDNGEIDKIKERLVNYRDYLNSTGKQVVEKYRTDMITDIENNGYSIVWG